MFAFHFQVPKEIGQLTKLSQLDLSHNPLLSALPDELGRLHRLYELGRAGLSLQLPPAILEGTTRGLVMFLYHRLKKVRLNYTSQLSTVIYNVVKLSVYNVI